MAERLSSVDEAEPQFASLSNLFRDAPGRKADAQMVNGRQKAAVTLLLDEGIGQVDGDVVYGSTAIHNAVAQRTGRDAIACQPCLGFDNLLVSRLTEIRGKHALANPTNAARREMNRHSLIC